jgi:hypothetical protein
MPPRDPHDFQGIGRAGVELLLQTGYYAKKDAEAAQARKESDRRWRAAGKTLERIRKGR